MSRVEIKERTDLLDQRLRRLPAGAEKTHATRLIKELNEELDVYTTCGRANGLNSHGTSCARSSTRC